MTSVYFKSDFDLECTICFEKILDGDHLVILPCQHFFCYKCTHNWTKHNNICPICRNPNDMVPPGLKDNDITQVIINDYQNYIALGHKPAPPFTPAGLCGDIKLFFDFEYEFGLDSVMIEAIDLINNVSFKYGTLPINQLNHKFLLIKDFKNLSCVKMYINSDIFAFRFHIDLNILHTDKFNSSVFIKVNKNHTNLQEFTQVKLEINGGDDFSWGKNYERAEKYPRNCIMCGNPGFWVEDNDCFARYEFNCHHEVDVTCCTIL